MRRIVTEKEKNRQENGLKKDHKKNYHREREWGQPK
jgi:hypothetical protein